jgi:hypothetical protein
MQQVLPKSRLTVDEVARSLKLKPADIMRLICKDRLIAVIVDGRYEVGVGELDRAANAGRLAGDLKRPAGLETDYAAEKKARQRLSESLVDVLTPAAIRAEMQRVARPGQKVWDVRSVRFDMASAPLAFLETMAAPVSAGEFQVRIKGQENPQNGETLRTAYLRSRARKAAKNLLGVNQSPDSIYDNPAKFDEFMGKVASALEGESISVRETRLIEFETSKIEIGSERQVILQKTPVDVVVSVPLAAVAPGLRAMVPTFF